ncbi:MAG TPA: acyl-CoA carboxylase subunit epsilon [Pseudonocardia sp.]|jgi:hypothetical protein|nr:acyl-CoA carboxylase subunit epsilon [Pseudonocardia sp.]
MAPTDETPDQDEQTPEQRRALFRVVRGEPDDAELAALAAVLAVAAASGEPAEPGSTRRTSFWTDRQAALRQPLYPGPGAWRASTLPR